MEFLVRQNGGHIEHIEHMFSWFAKYWNVDTGYLFCSCRCFVQFATQ